MAATIGEIAVNVVANTRKFFSSTKKVRREFKRVSATAKATIATVGKLGLGLTGLGGIGVVAGLTRTADQLDRLAKVSSRLGIASDKLAGLRHAAEQTGVSSNTLDMALQRMVRRVAEAAAGTGEARKAISELGLSAKELAALSPDKQFARIAEEMSGVTKQGDRVRLAMKFFDSEGVALVNTLKLGSDGLREMQKEAESLGIAFSGEELAKVEKMNDELDRLRKAFGGLAGELVIRLAPGVSETIEGLLLLSGSKRAPSGKLTTDRIRAMQRRTGVDYTQPRTGVGNSGVMGAAASQRLALMVMGRRQRAESFGAGPGVIGSSLLQAIQPAIAANAQAVQGIGGQALTGLLTYANDQLQSRRGDLLSQGSDSPSSQSRGVNAILEKGTQAAFSALRQNLNKGGDKQTKLAEKRVQQNEQMITLLQAINTSVFGEAAGL